MGLDLGSFEHVSTKQMHMVGCTLAALSLGQLEVRRGKRWLLTHYARNDTLTCPGGPAVVLSLWADEARVTLSEYRH